MSEWQKVKIGDIATESKILELNPDANKKVRVRLNVNGVEKRPLITEKEGATKYYIRKTGQFIYGRQNFHKGAFGVIPNSLDGFSSSADLPAFDIDKSCLPEWLVYWFKTDNRYLHLAKHAKGISSQRVSTPDFYKTEILLPDINTQVNIINKIQSVEQKCIGFNSEILNQQTYSTKLRQAILQEAIEGKLTADWRVKNPVEKGNPDFDAVALLATIKAEKQKLIAEGKIKKEKPLAPISPDDVPFDLPDGWVWVRLGEIGTKFDYGSSSKSSKKGKVPVLRMGNIQNGRIDWTDLVYTDDAEEIAKYSLQKFDLLFNRTNSRELVGKTALFDSDKTAIHAGYLVRFKMLNSVSSYFCNYLMSSDLHREWCNQVKTDALGQSNINATKLKDFLFPLPPLAEQHAIVARVDCLLASVNALEQQVKERKTYAVQLMQAVLKEAFAG